MKVFQQKVLVAALTACCVAAAGIASPAFAGKSGTPAARNIAQAVAMKRSRTQSQTVSFTPGAMSYFVVPAGNAKVTVADLKRAGLRGLMGTVSQVYEDGNNRQVPEGQALQPGLIYAARFDRATTIDFRTRTVFQADARTRLPADTAASNKLLARAGSPDDGTKVVLLYDASYNTKRYKCWNGGKSGAWDGITDSVTGADNVKNAGVVRRGRTIYVKDEAGMSGQERVTVYAPAEPGQSRQAVSWATRYDSQRGAYAIDIPANAAIGDYQIAVGQSRDNYVTTYVIFDPGYANQALNAEEVRSYAYVDEDWQTIDDKKDYLNHAFEGPAGTWVYGYRGDTTAESGANGGVFGQRMVEIAAHIHGGNTTTTLEAAVHAYEVMGQRIYWTSGQGYYGNDNGTINSFDNMLKGTIKAPGGLQTRTELDVVASEKAALGLGWTNRLPQSYIFAAGQCFNYGTNLSAMLRSMGIPTRTQYTAGGAGWPGSFHVWAEAYLDTPSIHPREQGWWKSSWYKFDANRQYNTTGTSQIAHIEGNIAPIVIDGYGDYLLNEYKKCNGISYRGAYNKNAAKCTSAGAGSHAAVMLKPNTTLNSTELSYDASLSSSPWGIQDLFAPYNGPATAPSVSYVYSSHHGYALNNSQAGTDGGSGLIDDNTKENDLPALEAGVPQPTLVAGFGFSMYRVPVNGRAKVTVRMSQGADKARVLATYDRMIYSTGKRYELSFDAQSDANGVLTIDSAGKNQIYLWVENKFSHSSPGVGQEVTWVTLLDDSATTGNNAPVASFTSTTSNLTATFTDTSTDSDGSIASWSWDFGDGVNSTTANPSHTYASAGTYSVKLTVTDDKGATNTTTRSVTVAAGNSAPVANFTVTTSNLTAAFTDTSTDSDGSIASRSWDFGDGTSSTTANPSHTYASAGTYSVKLTVTDDKGATNTTTRSVTVAAGNSAPVANFTVTTSNLTAAFTDTSTDSDGSIASRSWDFGDGSSSTATNPSHAYASAGTYSVKLTVTDDKGATNTTTRSVTVTSAGGGVQTYSNDVDVVIPDNTTVSSTIAVAGRTGNAPSNAKVTVNIIHPNRGQLTISLVAPDGSVYTLKNSDLFDTAANVNATYTVNLSSEALNGNWKLRVNDFGYGATGKIDNWSVVF